MVSPAACLCLFTGISLTVLPVTAGQENWKDAGPVKQRIHDYLAKNRFTGAVHLYKKIGLDTLYAPDDRAGAWFAAANLYEHEILDYRNAVAMYLRLQTQFPGHETASEAARRIGPLRQELQKYARASAILQSMQYGGGRSNDEALSDIRNLKSLLKEYPGFYNRAKVYALLGNRYLQAGKWGRAYYYCSRAQKLSPYLSLHTPLFQDYQTAAYRFYRKYLTAGAFFLLLVLLGAAVWQRPREKSAMSYVKTCLLLLTAWWGLALLVFSVPLVTGIPEPVNAGFSEPVISLLWFVPFVSRGFGWFLLYSTGALLLMFIITPGWAMMKNPVARYLSVFLLSLIVMGMANGLFYLFHCHSETNENNFIYFKEEIEEYVPRYPGLFKDYPELLKTYQ